MVVLVSQSFKILEKKVAVIDVTTASYLLLPGHNFTNHTNNGPYNNLQASSNKQLSPDTEGPFENYNLNESRLKLCFVCEDANNSRYTIPRSKHTPSGL
jgi:hypothetical protein